MNIGNTQVLRQKQEQKLKLSKAQMQKLEVLRMPLHELNEHIQQQITENPLLEMQPVEYLLGAEDARIIAAAEESAATADRQASLDYADYKHYASRPSGDYTAIISTGKATFAEMLHEQLAALRLSTRAHELCSYLIQCLDRQGYLRDDISTLAEELGIHPDEVMQGVYTLQSLQPAGVAARSLQECLILQLFEIGHLNRHSIKLVREGLISLAQNNVSAIATLLGLNKQSAIDYCTLVRGLNPIPSAGFDTGEQRGNVIPDAYIRRDGEAFSVVMNSSFTPRLVINSEYNEMLRQEGQHSPELSAYISARTADAQALIQSVEEREHTLVRIIRHTLGAQQQFYSTGRGLKPMTMQSVADALGLHVSTVSRAVQDKYIVCAAGTMPLKGLFIQALESDGGTAISPAYIKERITDCVQSEDKHAPLSDEDIRSALKMLGISVSRRTVTKYRESLGIPSSRLRKQF